MRRYVSRVTALILAAALALSVCVFVADDAGTMTFALKAGTSSTDHTITSRTIKSDHREDGRSTYNEVVVAPGETVFVKYLLRPDVDIPGDGSGTDPIDFDKGFFRFLSGTTDDYVEGTDVIFTGAFDVSGWYNGYSAYKVDGASPPFVKLTANHPGACAAGDELYVATICLTVKGTSGEGWVTSWPGITRTLGGVPYYYGPSWIGMEHALEDLVARFAPAETYRVTWKSQDGGAVLAEDNYEPGTKPWYDGATPTKPGSRFVGWATEPGQETGTPETGLPAVTGDATYYAALAPAAAATYTVTFDSDGGSAIPAQTVTDGERAAKPANPTKPGSTFDGWTLNGKPYSFSVPVTKDVTLKAAWKAVGGSSSGGTTADGYSVNLVPADGGKITASPATRVADGKTVTLTPKPDGGKALTRLTVTGPDGAEIQTERKGDGTYTFAMPKGDVTVRAAFATKVASPDDTGVSQLLNTDDHMLFLRGYTDGTIRPTGNMTRAEAAQAFYRLLRNPEVTLTKSFPDVPDGVWFTQAIRTLASMGVINGGDDGSFRPDRLITRAEFAAIATRFAKATGGTVTFQDVPENHWAHDNIATAASYGWINGFGDGNFGPGSNITRAEVATIINHMLGRAADRSYVAAHRSELNQFSDLQDTAQWYYFDMIEASNAHLYDGSGGSETWTKLAGDAAKS